MKTIISTNPGEAYEILGSVTASTPQEIKEAVKCAKRAWPSWNAAGVEARKACLSLVFELFQKRADELQTLIVREVGKTQTAARLSYDNAMSKFAWFLENAAAATAPETTFEDELSLHQIILEPHGVAGVITPWNFPFGMFVWGVIPNLLVGNSVVFKISEECPLCGKLIDDVMREAALPAGVFSQVFGDREEGAILLDQEIDFIWFTGSTRAGQEIYNKAASKFIRAVFELGGSNAAIVFEDADIDRYAEKIYTKRYGNCGQTCDALKRLLVHRSIFEKTLIKLKAVVQAKKFGSPADADTELGPLVAERQVRLLEEQVADARAKGANIVLGGKRPPHLSGAYFEPTIIAGVTQQMRIWSEEVFGPALSVIPFADEEEAVRIANCTNYGLGAIVFSEDLKRARRVAGRLEAGTVEINGASHWLHCNPFGGYKRSGIGREHGMLGFKELCRVKVVSEEKMAPR